MFEGEIQAIPPYIPRPEGRGFTAFFDKECGATNGCNFCLLDIPPGDPNMGETTFSMSWVDVLPQLGRDGWHIGGMMEENALQVIILQRRITPCTAPTSGSGDHAGEGA